MIEVSGIVYDYPAGRALHGVGFTVRDGAVLALVGPNGAGKSTLLRCMAALDRPAEGSIRIAGVDVEADPRGAHALLGYLPDFFGLYDELTVRQALRYAARARGVPEDKAEAAVIDAARRVELDGRLETRAGELSRGLRQRLAIGQTIVHRPRVLLLDEPAAGLDPEARRGLSDLITSLARDGATLIVSSHILAELEDYCTEMLMLRDGRIAGGGVILAGRGPGAPAGERARLTLAEPVADLGDRLAALGLVVEHSDAAGAVVRLSAEPQAHARALAALVQAGLPLVSFAPVQASLEEAYMAEARGGGGPTSSGAGASA